MGAKSKPRKKALRPSPSPTDVTLPRAIWTHSHGAMARIEALEEYARRLLAAGGFPFHYTRRPAAPRSAIQIATDQGGILLGPDGRPADLR